MKRQLAKGRGCSEEWTRSRRAMLDKHFIPRFRKTRLDALTRPMIERFLLGLPLSNQTRNHLQYAMKTVLQEAEDEGIIARNPLDRAEPMRKQGRRRDAFTLAELGMLFPRTTKGLLKVWGSPKYAALFLTMAYTGIREGEARALCWQHVLPEGWLSIEQAVK